MEKYGDESKCQTWLSSDLINAGSTAIFDIALLSFSGPAYKSQKKVDLDDIMGCNRQEI